VASRAIGFAATQVEVQDRSGDLRDRTIRPTGFQLDRGNSTPDKWQRRALVGAGERRWNKNAPKIMSCFTLDRFGPKSTDGAAETEKQPKQNAGAELEYDLVYIANWSLLLDIKVLFF